MDPLRVAAWRALSLGAALIVGLGCSEGTAPQAAAAIRVTLAPAGGDAGAGAYRVSLDGRSTELISGAQAALFGPVSPGEHLVSVDQLPPTCQVSGDPSQVVDIAPGDTAEVQFEVSCSDRAGQLLVRLSVTGEDQDPNGYTVLLDGNPAASGLFGNIALAATPGSHSVALEDLTRSCHVAGDSVRTAALLPGGTLTVDFEVTCAVSPPAGPGQEIVFDTDRAGVGPTGETISQLYSVNVDGTGLHLISEIPRGAQTDAAWSPDGSRLLFSVMSEGLDQSIFIMNADGSDVAPFLRMQGEAAWSPDMTQVALSTFGTRAESAIGIVRADAPDPDSLKIVAAAQSTSRPTWSPDGTRLAYVTQFVDEFESDIALEVLDLATLVSDTLPTGLGFMGAPQWSPDGSWLLFEGSIERFSPSDLYLIHPDGSGLTALTHTPESEMTPTWSPDGSHIAYATTRDGNAEIYVMKSDGTEPIRLTNNLASDVRPAWRP